MTPFLIFAIVLTIAYILYYATIITMDLNAKNKKGDDNELLISTGEASDADEDYVPKNVVETSTGGFDFVNPEEIPAKQEEIAEAPDEEINNQSTQQEIHEADNASESNQNHTDENLPFERDKNTYDKEVNIEPENNSEVDKEVQESSTEEGSQQDEEKADFDNITTAKIGSASNEDQHSAENAETEDSFDPYYKERKHQVSEVYEPQENTVVKESLQMIQNSLSQIKQCTSNEMTPLQLMQYMTNGSDNNKIDKQDVFDKL